MKVWSKGLGQLELVLDFSKYTVRRDGGQIFIEGIITDPVYWDFRITLTGDDVPGLLHVATNRPMIGMLLRNLSKILGFFACAFAGLFRGAKQRGRGTED